MDTHNDLAGGQACENCGAALRGGFCHRCGQRAHNPLHNLPHAVEEVFESLWHLDGRIFRTLRDLFVPGRVAAGYLSGHRVRYIAPLRLFVILSLVTFFVGKSTLHVEQAGDGNSSAGTRSAVAVSGIDADIYAGATDFDDVMAIRARQLGELQPEAEDEVGGIVMSLIGPALRKQLDEGARRRLVELGLEPSRLETTLAAEAASEAPATGAAASPAAGEGWFSSWMKRRAERASVNIERITDEPDELVRLFLGALPGALFVLVPLFAMFLKLMYVRAGRGYLEHLVVALYSHAALLLALLAVFLLVGLADWLPALDPLVGVGLLALAVVVPLYLLVMQKRVYAQGWLLTTLKYLAIGAVYSVLLSLAILYALLSGLSS